MFYAVYTTNSIGEPTTLTTMWMLKYMTIGNMKYGNDGQLCFPQKPMFGSF